eukprot:SAG11_NODE_20405_length_446_cov_0.596542_1_plen_56_part_01
MTFARPNKVILTSIQPSFSGFPLPLSFPCKTKRSLLRILLMGADFLRPFDSLAEAR